MEEVQSKPVKKRKSLIIKLIYAAVIAVLVIMISLFIRFQVVYSYHEVQGESMCPTYNYPYNPDKLDKVFVRKNANFKHGDVIIFDNAESNKVLIKRVVAMAGDEIRVVYETGYYYIEVKIFGTDIFLRPDGSKTVINADNQVTAPAPDGYAASDDSWYYYAKPGSKYQFLRWLFDQPQPVKLSEDEVFVMGDHRENSSDSRYIGLVKEEIILGRVDFVVKGEWSGAKKLFFNFKIKFTVKKR